MKKIDDEHVQLLETALREIISENKNDYQYSAAYNFADFPLPRTPAFSSECSEVVDAGYPLGKGRFCDYLILGAGLTIVIWYNRFEPDGSV